MLCSLCSQQAEGRGQSSFLVFEGQKGLKKKLEMPIIMNYGCKEAKSHKPFLNLIMSSITGIQSRCFFKLTRAALFFFLAGALLVAVAQGAYLKNIPISLRQPDGTELNCFATGDEYHNWLHDQSDYTILQDPTTGYYVYARLVSGNLAPSALIAGISDPELAGLKPGLNLSSVQIQAKRREIQSAMKGVGQPEAEEISEAPKSGTINNLVVFIRFSDETEFTDNMSTYQGYFNTNTSSMANYFQEVSYTGLSVGSTFYPSTVGSTVVSYQDSNPRAYYQPYNAASNPTGYNGSTERMNREHLLLKNAINSIASQVSSSLNLDGDGDGRVDNVCFVVKGSPTAWATLLWPHQWSLYSQTVYINSKRVYTYNFQLQSVLGVGVLCHEMMHSIGAPDLYHYTSDGITPVYQWDLMEYDRNPPQHIGAYMKYRYTQWLSSIPEITTTGTYTLNPLTSATNNCYKIASPNSATEYFVVEYRRRTGTFETSLPGEGLLVYRINTAMDGQGNSNGPPDEVYIYRPNGTTTVNGTPSQANLSSNVGRTSFNNAYLVNGSPGGLNITNVGAAGSTISFDVTIAGSSPTLTLDAPNGGEVWPAGSTQTITWHSSQITGSIAIAYSYNGGSSFIEITSGAPNTGSYNWTIPYLPSSNCRIRLTAMSGAVTAQSAAAFSITSTISLGDATDHNGLTWNTDSLAPWFGEPTDSHDQVDAAQSASLNVGQSSSLQATFTGPGTLSFYWKASSASAANTLTLLNGDAILAQITGTAAWQQVTLQLSAGTTLLQWIYAKNESTATNLDYGWLDQVTYVRKGTTDFNADGNPDIFWRNYTTGNNSVWSMNGATRLDVLSLPQRADTNWDIVGTGDFTGDGLIDILWRNYSTGANELWVMYSEREYSALALPSATNLNWKACGTGDFNQDGKLDIVWRNYETGANAIWLMDGNTRLGVLSLLSATNLSWRLEGVGDFDQDGKPDLVWRNYANGTNSVWLMDGSTRLNVISLPAATNLNWKLEGVEDFNGDGTPDLLWRNYANGNNALWFMDGVNQLGISMLTAEATLSWRINDNF
jgi:M6 family metalloprotease-like protein